MITPSVIIDNLHHPQGCDESDWRETIQAAVQALHFKEYFKNLYGEGLEVANWHKNGDLEPYDNFYDNAETL